MEIKVKLTNKDILIFKYDNKKEKNNKINIELNFLEECIDKIDELYDFILKNIDEDIKIEEPEEICNNPKTVSKKIAKKFIELINKEIKDIKNEKNNFKL